MTSYDPGSLEPLILIFAALAVIAAISSFFVNDHVEEKLLAVMLVMVLVTVVLGFSRVLAW